MHVPLQDTLLALFASIWLQKWTSATLVVTGAFFSRESYSNKIEAIEAARLVCIPTATVTG